MKTNSRAPEDGPTSGIPSRIHLEEIACTDCALGRASGADEGQFCPFIIRHYRRGDVLSLAGDPIDYVWLVKNGVIGLSRSRDPAHVDDVDGLCLPGSFVGLECLVGKRYLRTARALSSASLCGATLDGFHSWLRESDERIATVMRAALRDPLLVGPDKPLKVDELAAIVDGPLAPRP